MAIYLRSVPITRLKNRYHLSRHHRVEMKSLNRSHAICHRVRALLNSFLRLIEKERRSILESIR